MVTVKRRVLIRPSKAFPGQWMAFVPSSEPGRLAEQNTYVGHGLTPAVAYHNYLENNDLI